MQSSSEMITKGSKLYLVTGGAGFIGSHIANFLHAQGKNVLVVDIIHAKSDSFNTIDYICGDLRNADFCDRIVKNVHTVIHMAANMGGMGTIHRNNDFVVYQDNSMMTVNILKASVYAGVKCFLFASSACVYPDSLQSNLAGIIGLKESDAWSTFPPSPQGLYGFEKLVDEMLILQYKDTMDIKIARFHNVYGPGGAWTGGREKAPAAFARKAVVSKMAQCDNNSMQDDFEIWGDGTQRRSFLYISDAVDAIFRLLNTDGLATINVGSEGHVSMNELAEIACTAAKLRQEDVRFHYKDSRPIGVKCRTSDNTQARIVLNDWEPTVSLKEGMSRTVEWVKSQIEEEIKNLDSARHSEFLDGLRHSSVINLKPKTIVFAILLPVTSRGTASPKDCIDNLTRFGLYLWRTTKNQTYPHHNASFRLKIYLALDSDDGFLVDDTKAEDALRSSDSYEIHRIVCDFPKGHVCSLWRECAKRAWKEGADYMCLMGDDVELLDDGWLLDVAGKFSELSNNEENLTGFGCVAFTDTSFPGMPTFPIVSKVHMDLFDGEVIPDCFINQDGDPYLFQLYRRFGSALTIPSRIQNNVGGSENARYQKKHAADWTFGTLDDGTENIINSMKNKGVGIEKKITLDVVVPSYRIQMIFLKPILELKASPTCSVMWIIIIDDPQSPSMGELQRNYGMRADVRIRVNAENSGGCASRNRGMKESAAEWILFLDDDVIPQNDLLIEAETVIRANPSAAGFVGNAKFPPANTIFTTSVHLAGVTYFWDIAEKIKDDLPWGVTANLIVKRVKDDISFNVAFPKTGGGEDIDFCIRKRDWFIGHELQGFKPAPKVVVTHPWWNEGRRSYRRFFMWGKGDGALASMFPQHCYIDTLPNSTELGLYCFLAGTFGLAVSSSTITFLGYWGVLSVLLASIGYDIWQHLSGKIIKDSRTTLTGFCWVVAIMEGSIVRICSEGGRVAGQIEPRGEFYLPLRPRPRFDWFVGRINGPAANEINKNFQRFLVWTFIMSLVSLTIYWGELPKPLYYTNQPIY